MSDTFADPRQPSWFLHGAIRPLGLFTSSESNVLVYVFEGYMRFSDNLSAEPGKELYKDGGFAFFRYPLERSSLPYECPHWPPLGGRLTDDVFRRPNKAMSRGLGRTHFIFTISCSRITLEVRLT